MEKSKVNILKSCCDKKKKEKVYSELYVRLTLRKKTFTVLTGSTLSLFLRLGCSFSFLLTLIVSVGSGEPESSLSHAAIRLMESVFSSLTSFDS